MSEHAGVVVVLPTYNERENVLPLITEVRAVLDGARILVVDDDSPDGTADAVEAADRGDGGVTVLRRGAKTGLGSAYVDAFTRLLADPQVELIVTMDADFSHPPTYLPALVSAARDADVVVGSRYVPGGRIVGWERWRRALSLIGNRYARLVCGVDVHDLTAGFVCFRRDALAKIDLQSIASAGYAYTIESKCLAVWTGARVREVPISFEERRLGESKIGSGVILEGILAPIRLRRARRRHRR